MSLVHFRTIICNGSDFTLRAWLSPHQEYDPAQLLAQVRFAVVGCVNARQRILVHENLIKPGGSKVRTRKPSLNENHQLVENSSLFLPNTFVFPRPVPCARRELSRKLRKARLASNYADTSDGVSHKDSGE